MIQLEKNIKNKTWWISIISALVLLAQSYGFDLTKYIGTNWQDTLNIIFSILVLLGVSVNTTAIKNADSSAKTIEVNADVQNSSNKSTPDTTVQNTVQATTDTSASSKIVIDNPDNIQEIGATVNSTSSVKPQ